MNKFRILAISALSISAWFLISMSSASPLVGPAYEIPPKNYSKLIRVYEPTKLGSIGFTAPISSEQPRISLGSFIWDNISLELFRELGTDLFFSHTDFLGTPETVSGIWDWESFNQERKRAIYAGSRWGLFLQSAYPPDWFNHANNYERMQCLEHKQNLDAISVWSPARVKFVDRILTAVRTRYGILDALIVGQNGNGGFAGFPNGFDEGDDTLRKSWNSKFGNEHNHLGFWCGDQAARMNFQKAMIAKYGSLNALNESWKTHFNNASEIEYPLTATWTYVARLDFAAWYKNGISSAAATSLKIARRKYPSTSLLLPIDKVFESVKLGVDLSALVKSASKNNSGIYLKVSADTKNFMDEQLKISAARAACTFYNVPLWTASNGNTSTFSFDRQLFQTLSSGAVGMITTSDDWVNGLKSVESHERNLIVSKPVVELAVLFPSSAHDIRVNETIPPTLYSGIKKLRTTTDFDILDERLISEGALDHYKIAAFWEGTVWSESALAKLEEWVASGGTIIAFDFGKIASDQGDRTIYTKLFGYAGRLERYHPNVGQFPDDNWIKSYGKGRTIFFPAGRVQLDAYNKLITSYLNPTSLLNIDENESVFITQTQNSTLYFNNSNAKATIVGKNSDSSNASINISANSTLILNYTERTPRELLLQCEKFTNLNGCAVVERTDCSPGIGATAVDLLSGKSIETRITLLEEGSFRVVTRTLQKGVRGAVNIEIDGAALTTKSNITPYADTIDYGVVKLARGIHKFVMKSSRPTKADFLLLCEDMRVIGYRFSRAQSVVETNP